MNTITIPAPIPPSIALQDRQTLRGLVAWLRISPDVQGSPEIRREAVEALQRLLVRDEAGKLIGWLVQPANAQPRMYWANNPEDIAQVDHLQSQVQNGLQIGHQIMPLYVGGATARTTLPV